MELPADIAVTCANIFVYVFAAGTIKGNNIIVLASKATPTGADDPPKTC
jgi:hypothetical protein